MRAGSSRRRCSPRPVSASTPSTSLGGNALVNAPIATQSPSRCGAGGFTCPARSTTPPPHPPPTQRTRTIPHQRGLTDRHWGYGWMWRAGWYGEAPAVRDHRGLSDEESVMMWVYLGTEPEGTRPPPRPDTDPAALSTILDD